MSYHSLWPDDHDASNADHFGAAQLIGGWLIHLGRIMNTEGV